MNERFVAVFPSLVRALGGDLGAAAVLQAIHYRAQAAEPATDGRRWLRLPLADIADEIGLSVDQTQRATKRLRDAGLLLSEGQTGRSNYLRWAVDYEAVGSLDGKHAESRPSERTQDRGGKHAESRQKARGIASPLLIEETKKVENLPAAVAAEPNAGQIVTAWIDTLRIRPPERVIGQTAREVRLLLDQGFPPRVILEACKSVSSKGLHPSTLASEVNMLVNPPTRNTKGPATAEQRMAGLTHLLVGSADGHP